MHSVARLRPEPLKALPRPLAGFMWPLSKGRERKDSREGEGTGREGKRGEGKEESRGREFCTFQILKASMALA